MNRSSQEQNCVAAFMRRFGQTTRQRPSIPLTEEAAARLNIMKQEWEELMLGMLNADLDEVADGLADLLYTLLGTAETYGIDLCPLFLHVHERNMAKVWHAHELDQIPAGAEVKKVEPELYVVMLNGKVIKPPSFTPPNIKQLLEIQRAS